MSNRTDRAWTHRHHAYSLELLGRKPLVSTTMVLQGHLIQGGVKFLWWVIDGFPSTVTVSHPALGTRSGAATGDLKAHARRLAAEMLAERTGG